MIEHPDLVVLGQVSVRTNETGEDIIIKELFFDDIGTRKHEHCHEVQYHQNRLYTSCRTPVKVFNELECYSSEYLPDIVYNLIYGNP